jgi:hypothetical protein
LIEIDDGDVIYIMMHDDIKMMDVSVLSQVARLLGHLSWNRVLVYREAKGGHGGVRDACI